ncbi:MAG: class I SAM-dependent methyltransferase, partial [Halobacteriovoraceae bacterium]|nr:class I SAM-dependent methyltransferase [Halobacteriovoraceae bacterium]
NRKPLTLREDFGGTAALACDWVKQSPEHSACSVDLDPEPISYGKENHYSRLTKTEKERMEYIEGNVLSDYEMKSDIIVGFNFSYFIFKKRQQLLEYFKKVREGISDDGLFFVDIFGGEECMSPLEEETEHDGHDYFWDLDKFNAVTNEVLYYIHFRKHDDKIKYERVFTYDWRMWTIPEVREIMEEAGFSKTVVFWEGDDDDGEGDGNFYQTKLEENCESWVSYIVGLA